MVAIPIFAAVKIWMNHSLITQSENLTFVTVFYEEIRTKTKAQTMFNVFAMLRRLILIITITNMESLPYF